MALNDMENESLKLLRELSESMIKYYGKFPDGPTEEQEKSEEWQSFTEIWERVCKHLNIV